MSNEVLIEPIDPSRMWGVFGAEDYSPDPIAIFTSQEAAIVWAKYQEGDDGCLGNCDYCVLPVFITGDVANHGIDAEAVAAMVEKHGGTWRAE